MRVADDDLASGAGVGIVVHAHAPAAMNIVEGVDELDAVVGIVVEVVAGSANRLRPGLAKGVVSGGLTGLVYAFSVIAVAPGHQLVGTLAGALHRRHDVLAMRHRAAGKDRELRAAGIPLQQAAAWVQVVDVGQR